MFAVELRMYPLQARFSQTNMTTGRPAVLETEPAKYCPFMMRFVS